MNTGDKIVLVMMAWPFVSFPFLIGIARWIRFCSEEGDRSERR